MEISQKEIRQEFGYVKIDDLVTFESENVLSTLGFNNFGIDDFQKPLVVRSLDLHFNDNVNQEFDDNIDLLSLIIRSWLNENNIHCPIVLRVSSLSLGYDFKLLCSAYRILDIS